MTSFKCSLSNIHNMHIHRIVVLPELSNPNIRIRISLGPSMELNILEKTKPMWLIIR